jgi:glutamate N-acetyltransferase/amino-acid N-acetyltransferase
MRFPQDWYGGSTAAGLKPSGRPDLALLVSARPAAWAFAGTLNRAAAPSVQRGRALYAQAAPLRALVVNSGIANCATGPQGVEADRRMAELAASRLQISPEEVLTASTGVIGVPLPLERIEEALPRIELGEEVEQFVEGILTTDTRLKLAEAQIGPARLVGFCKGSGMIAPHMATMLAYLVTDAAIPQAELRRGFSKILEESFNQVSVDTDTSTNDMAVLLANGAAGPVEPSQFWQGVRQVAISLARQLARDGEGATKLLTVRVRGARSAEEARRAALAVASSPLWKSAAYGRDPNWGRILMALGKSGAEFDLFKVTISLQGHLLYAGAPLPFAREEVSRSMEAEEVVVEVDLREGEGSGEAWGCDLSEEYVRINALYTT